MHPARSGSEDGGATPKRDGDNLESSGNHHLKLSGAVALKITLVFAVVAITCLLFYQSSYPLEFYLKSNSLVWPRASNISSSCENHDAQSNASSSFYQFMSQNTSLLGKEENDELEETLRNALMKDNKTVIITSLNAAWTEPNSMLDLFLESFRIGNGTEGLLKHVVFGAFDQTAYNRCLAERLHCYAITTDGVDFSGEAPYMTEHYLKMMWRRFDFLRTVLQLGYDFVFTDVDVMWLRNPLERFYPDGEFQIACDRNWAGYSDLSNSPNGGFYYVKSNSRTIQFFNYWYTGQDYFPGKHDQDVLIMIKNNPFIPGIGLEIRFLNPADFGGFCEPNQDLDRVITMHANCCVGLDNKVRAIKMVIDDWKRYMSLPVDQRNSTIRSWTLPRICG
ncbi:hypothetical protein C2S52_008532 [Perilla frutescens var. hirtella]|nr:hypothetical protein C2S52_008532 [Perilla frutescens var. hirtella]